MDTVTCFCSKCGTTIGRFENLWDRIGKTNYSPIRAISQGLGGLVIAGEVRAAAKAGVIEDSFLQDLACKSCGEKLGLRCDRAPAGHILIRDQLILRVGGMSIVSDNSGKKASLNVRRKFSLTGHPPLPANVRDTYQRSPSPMSNLAQIEEEFPPLASTTVLPINDRDPLQVMTRFAEWAEDAIRGQRDDIDRISGVVCKIERDIHSFKDFMSEMRRDLATRPVGTIVERMGRDVSILKSDVEEIWKEVQARPGAVCPVNDDGLKLSVDEVDVLTDSISKISQKVNEVDSLKLELQFMKSRLKRLEDASRSVRQSIEPRTKENSSASPAYHNPMVQQLHGLAVGDSTEDDDHMTDSNVALQRKRKSDHFEDNATLLTSPLVIDIKKRGRYSDMGPSTNRTATARKPSCLSNVQLIDDFPDPVDDGNLTADDNQSDEDFQPPGKPTGGYESAPEARPVRRKTLQTQLNRDRDPLTPENFSTPFPEASKDTPQPAKRGRPRGRTTLKTPRRRAYSVGLRTADGVRLTKAGKPDGRSGNYKYLKQYYERLRVQKEQGEEGIEESVIPSIENKNTEGDEMDREATKHSELEARDRLVMETLEREL